MADIEIIDHIETIRGWINGVPIKHDGRYVKHDGRLYEVINNEVLKVKRAYFMVEELLMSEYRNRIKKCFGTNPLIFVMDDRGRGIDKQAQLIGEHLKEFEERGVKWYEDPNAETDVYLVWEVHHKGYK